MPPSAGTSTWTDANARRDRRATKVGQDRVVASVGGFISSVVVLSLLTLDSHLNQFYGILCCTLWSLLNSLDVFETVRTSIHRHGYMTENDHCQIPGGMPPTR